MRKPVATVQPHEAFKILAEGFRYNPYRLALLRRIYVGGQHTRSASCPGQSKIVFSVHVPPVKRSSPRR